MPSDHPGRGTHLLAVGDVDAQVDVPEAPAPDLPDQAVLAAHDELAAGGGGGGGHGSLLLVRHLGQGASKDWREGVCYTPTAADRPAGSGERGAWSRGESRARPRGREAASWLPTHPQLPYASETTRKGSVGGPGGLQGA